MPNRLLRKIRTRRIWNERFELLDKTRQELRAIAKFLPSRAFSWRLGTHWRSPLSLCLLHHYDLQLRRLKKTMESPGPLHSDIISSFLETLPTDQNFSLALIAACDLAGERAKYVWPRVKRELLETIHDGQLSLRKTIGIHSARHPQVFKFFRGLKPVERDIFLYVLWTHGVFQFFSFISPPERDSVEIKNVIAELSNLHPKDALESSLAPQGNLFFRGVLEPDFCDITRSWREVTLVPSQSCLEKLFGNSNLTYGSIRPIHETIFPHESLDEVILPEQTKKHIRSLCQQYEAQSARGKKGSLLFFFKGPSGTGKTMTAKAIAKELKKSILKIMPTDLSQRSLPHVLTYFSEQAKNHNQVLLFDECEDILRSNPFIGRSDAWAKILFENFQGVAIFTTNYGEPYGFERRMDYVVEFKSPSAKVRERILLQELTTLREENLVSSIPAPTELSKLATQYPIPGGYLRGALKLAAANSLTDKNTLPELTVRAIEESFEHFAKGLEKKRDEVHEPRLRLDEIALEAQTQSSVSLFIQYAREQLNAKNPSPLLPQGATAIFLGPPGTGKTITAEAIAHELQMPFRRVSPSTFMTMWFGETERKIRQIFKEAQTEKYVLFIDEAEGLFADRQGDISNTRTTIVNELLQQVESFKGVLIIATNFTDMMDSAFARRFVFHVKFTVPDAATRLTLWNKWSEPMGLSKNIFEHLAQQFELTGGEIRNVAVKAIATREKRLDELSLLCEQALRERTGVQKRRIGI